MLDGPRKKPVIGLTPLVAPHYRRQMPDGRVIMSPDPPAYMILIRTKTCGTDENSVPTILRVDTLELRRLDP